MTDIVSQFNLKIDTQLNRRIGFRVDFFLFDFILDLANLPKFATITGFSQSKKISKPKFQFSNSFEYIEGGS